MPSHLTRTVFRCLLANEPIVHRGCCRRQSYTTIIQAQDGRKAQTQRSRSFPVARRCQQRRTLFGLGMFSKPQQEPRDANYAPGIEKMTEYAKMERLKARLPPAKDVAQAFVEFFKSKRRTRTSVEDNQAQLALQSLKYCLRAQQDLYSSTGRSQVYLTMDDLACAAKRFQKPPRQMTLAHLELARALYEELSASDVSDIAKMHGLSAYVLSLCRFGRSMDARELLLQAEAGTSNDGVVSPENDTTLVDDGEPSESPEIFSQYGWLGVLKGFAREGNEQELLRTLELLKNRGLDRFRTVAHTMLSYYLAQQNVAAVRHWWNELRTRVLEAIGSQTDGANNALYNAAVADLLKWCLRTGNLDLGHKVVREVMETNPVKEIWDAVLVWAAGTKKSVDEIGRMLDVMEKSNDAISDSRFWRVPDSATINALLEFAISQKDPYMAERFISLGRDRGIEPDSKTFVLQMDYRLDVGDVDGALVAYKHLQALDVSTNEDVPAVNRLVVALCKTQRHDFDTIMNVAADLSDRRVRFEPATVSTLSLLHLNRDEIHDVIDLLNTHVYNYSTAESSSVREVFVAYCLDPATNTSRSWDAYTVLRNVFDETSREERTSLMLNYFTRERPDMGVHVFNHMRTHSRADTMPTIDTYVAAFLGCAKLRDLESLEVVHNQLKLDYNVNQTTYCRNGLIAAYSACEMPRQALNYWDDIVASREGPTYNSIHIALRACEKSPFGDLKAQEIWARLRRNKVDLDQSMWASYIAALAGNGDNGLATSQLEEAVEKGECEADVFLLGSLFNAAPGQMKQAEIEEFAKERFVEVWEEIEKVGWEEDENGMRRIKIDRSVTP